MIKWPKPTVDQTHIMGQYVRAMARRSIIQEKQEWDIAGHLKGKSGNLYLIQGIVLHDPKKVK
jgi:hypothetical protein